MGLLSFSVSATFLLIVSFLIRRIFLHRVPRQTFLILWYLIAIRLVLLNPVFRYLQGDSGGYQSLSIIIDDRSPFYDVISGLSYNALLNRFLFLGWLFIGGGLYLYVLYNHLRYVKVYKTALPFRCDSFDRIKEQYSISKRVRLKQLDRIDGPLTYGMIKPVILLPANLKGLSYEEMNFILLHEYVHIKRCDLVLKWLLMIVLCMNWFNPFIWMMYIFANRDIEISCDEEVINLSTGSQRSLYAVTLLKMEEKKKGISPLCIPFIKNNLEERIESLMKTPKRGKFIKLVSMGILLGILAIPCVSFASEKSSANENQMGQNDIAQDSPVILKSAVKEIEVEKES